MFLKYIGRNLSAAGAALAVHTLDLPRRDPIGNSVAFCGKNAMNKPFLRGYDADIPKCRDGKAPGMLSGLTRHFKLDKTLVGKYY